MSLFRQRAAHQRGQRKFYGMIVLIALGVAVFLGFNVWYNYGTVETQTHTVEDKDRAQGQDGKSSMRIYTEEGDVYEVSDTIFHGQWDSADVYSDIKVGQTYEFTTYGARIPFLSMFPVIIGVDDATS